MDTEVKQNNEKEVNQSNDMPLIISPDISKVLSEVFPSDDPLDRPDFNLIEFVNRNFPDEHSLGELDAFRNRLRHRILTVDEDISHAIQEQSRLGNQAVQDLNQAKEAINQLFSKITEIRGKAETSELMVQDICRDIRQLDYAKKHLQTTITALKRLHMLVSAVDQLELMASKRQYAEAANLLEAVKQLFTHFEAYTKIGKIMELQTTVTTIRDELASQIFGDFAAIGAFAELTPDIDVNTIFSKLSAACHVVDVLDPSTRKKLMNAFLGDQLASYNKTFGKGGESSTLEFAERRYPWFQRLMRSIKEKINVVFPKHWCMHHRLAIAFCERTRAHLLVQFGSTAPEDIEVTQLLKALHKTITFEKEMSELYEISSSNKEEKDLVNEDEDGYINPNSAEAIRNKYIKKQQEAEKEKKDAEKRGILGNMDETLPNFIGIVSACFDPYMTCYVSLERKNMEKMIRDVMSEEQVDREGPLPVFSSSVNLFVYIRNSVKRCTALTNGQTFFNLHKEFKACIRQYAELLSSKLPKGIQINSLGGEAYRLGEKQEEEICFVINTAEYCAETLPSLEEAIKSKIDKAYMDAVDLSEEADVFHDVAAVSMKCLVSGLEVKLENSLSSISKMPWASWEHVGDQSNYVVEMAKEMEMYIPTLRQMLSALYFNNFCDKFATSFQPRYLQMIMKCKRINEMGTQQLLLDNYAMKTLFLQLPCLGKKQEEDIQATPRYIKLVTNEVSKLETILKLIATPTDMLAQSFKMMWPTGTAEEFQNILQVKGLKRTEQQNLMELLGLQIQPTRESSNMTENLKRNVQSFTKGNRFGFG